MVHEFEESYMNDRSAAYGSYGASGDINSNGILSGSYNNYSRRYNDFQVTESMKPLKQSKFASNNIDDEFQESLEVRSKRLSDRIILINLISLLINLSLAIVAFYFSFANHSSATSAFAADCVLDFISSAILLWRYFGDLNSIYMHAREQIACFYLGILFEISGTAIIIKAITDMTSGEDPSSFANEGSEASYELFYLAIAASIACIGLTMFKCSIYNTLRDKSILLDVINTLVSTIFAMSIVMSQALINVNRSLWYLDPILSIVLALFMMGFGIKVIHQNFNILKPSFSTLNNNRSSGRNDNSTGDNSTFTALLSSLRFNNKKQQDGEKVGLISSNNNNVTSNEESGSYVTNLLLSQESRRPPINWQKTDYSTITFN